MSSPSMSIYWLSLEHICGCVLDWGCDARQKHEFEARFIPAAAPYPCPFHGSASGEAAAALGEGETRYLVASNVYYRSAPEGERENGRRNRKIALSASYVVRG